MHKYIKYSIFYTIFLTNLGLQSDMQTLDILQKMIDQNLSVYPYQEPDWPTNDVRFGEFLDWALGLQLNLQEFSKRRVSFSMLKKHLQKHQNYLNNLCYVDATTWKDLNMFAGQIIPTEYFAQKIDKTATIFGKTLFYFMLAAPTKNVDILIKRQNFVQTLLTEQSILARLEQELTSLQKVENIFISFWLNDPFKNATKRKFFNTSNEKINEYLNQSATALNIRAACEHQQRIVLAIATTVAAILLPIYGLRKITQKDCLHTKVENLAERLKNSGGPIFGLLDSCVENNLLIGSLAIASGCVNALYVQDSMEWAIDNFKLERLIYWKMQQVAKAVCAMENIYIMLKNHECLHEKLERFDCLKKLFDELQSAEHKNLFQYLKYDAHKSYAELTTNRGKALSYYKRFDAIKKIFEDALIAIGELDVVVGLAKLYQEHQNSNTAYSFVDFNTTVIEPSIFLEDTWNPCLPGGSSIIVNTIQLGCDGKAPHMIITGPNAGGKSTLLKGVALSLNMAQSFGMVPAKKATLTPFSLLMTYLNIVDDLAGGNSLFKSQVLRLKEILTEVSNLYQDAKGAIFLDEILNGTSLKEAEACAFSIASQLATYKNLINLIATHYPLLTELENYVPGYKNYHVSVIKSDQGDLIYPFKLAEGVSSQHIAIDILSQEKMLDPAILAQAQAILQNNGLFKAAI